MKFVYASIIALANAKSIINLKPYLLDERPEPVRAQFASQPNDCQVNPWILLSLVDQLAADTDKVKLDYAMKSLQKCKDNDHVKEVFTINYIMKKKPDLYANLVETDTGANAINRDLDTTTNEKVKDLLQITDPATTFKAWSDSKVFINMYKWNAWNKLYNQKPLQSYQYLTRKVDSFKDQKTKAEAKTSNKQRNVGNPAVMTPYTSSEQKLMQLRDYLPFAQPVIKKLQKSRFGN